MVILIRSGFDWFIILTDMKSGLCKRRLKKVQREFDLFREVVGRISLNLTGSEKSLGENKIDMSGN